MVCMTTVQKFKDAGSISILYFAIVEQLMKFF